MLKGQKKYIDKEQGKTKHEAPRSVNYRATQNKNNMGTTALERSVVYSTGGFKGLSLYKLHLRPDIILNTKTVGWWKIIMLAWRNYIGTRILWLLALQI